MRTELHYYLVTFFWLAADFKMVFKELIYTLSKAVSSINVTEFSEGGRDSTKKDDLKGFKESAEVYGKGIVHFPKDCKLYCGRGLARNQSGDKKGACENWRESKEIIRICIMILMTLVRCSLFR